jgi:hypothetical protein
VARQPILAHPALAPGLCVKCRHANQETDDFINFGMVAYKFGLGDRANATCERQLRDEHGHLVPLWLFEEYDGDNCTWFEQGPLELILHPGFDDT